VAPYATTAGILGLGSMSDNAQARPMSTGTMEAARAPWLSQAANQMERLEVPILGRPLQGLANWARGAAYDDPDKLERAAIGALDLL